MPISRIADLPAPVTAAKSDWLIADHWIGFTPLSDAPDAVPKCQNTITKQAANGYVVEYITAAFGKPNPGYETRPQYHAEREAHSIVAGRLVAVHRLRPTSRSLRTIIGDAEFDDLEDMWAESGKRRRWAVAFPIVESYEIPTKPLARDVFGGEATRRLFHHPSATLRPLNDDERRALAGLPLIERKTSNAWIAIEDETAIAAIAKIPASFVQAIDTDLAPNALEGLTEEQRRGVRRRAAWLAHRFVMKRQTEGKLTCDDCGFDPTGRILGTLIRARSLLDVHHMYPLEEGLRVTTLADFSLLCPTCHRFAHCVIQSKR